MSDTTAAEAAHQEATGKRTRIFVWKYQVEPAEPDMVPEERTVELVIPRKFKRFKFARKAGAGDFIGALEVVFGVEALEPLEDMDLDAEEWEDFMTRLGEAIGGTGNS
jgi:hypothetical protein